MNARTRALGVLLFLPVPVVLWLFTRPVLAVPYSLALGIALMLTHRLYARPWALARAERRCLWCAGPADGRHRLALVEPFGATTWQACGAAHLDLQRRMLAWAQSHALLLKAGILGALAVFLPAAYLVAFGRLGRLSHADCVAFFRLSVALSVLPLGLFATSRPVRQGTLVEGDEHEPMRVPFPVHIQALIGSAAVLWLFRLIGAAWLVLALWHAAQRLGLA